MTEPNMSTRTDNPAVREYLARTQAALAGLPDSEVEEILEDIGPHLAEVAEELGEDVSVETMTERLGTPEQYASELRAAAGYPPPVPEPRAGGRTLAARVALWGLVFGTAVLLVDGVATGDRQTEPFAAFVLLGLPFLALAAALVFTGRARLDAIAELPEARAVRRVLTGIGDPVLGYLRSLRPAWWLLRIVVLAIGLLIGIRADRGGLALMCVLGLAAVLAFARRVRTDARWRWVLIPAGAFAAGLAVAMLGGLSTAVASADTASGEYGPAPLPAGLLNEGQFVSNIFAFGPDGAPLPEVYLYDQDGRPITTYGIDGCEPTFGEPTDNRFPRPWRDHATGECRPGTDVPFTVAIPKPSSPSSTIPTTPSTAPTSSTSAPPTSK